jgi:hypothetical protein
VEAFFAWPRPCSRTAQEGHARPFRFSLRLLQPITVIIQRIQRFRGEWELLGFLPGPALMTLLRSCLPASLDDSRSVEQAAPGSKVRLAGLVAQKGEGKPVPLTLLDEWGMVDVDLPAGMEGPSEADLVLVEGKVESVFGAPVVRAAQGRGQPTSADGDTDCPELALFPAS